MLINYSFDSDILNNYIILNNLLNDLTNKFIEIFYKTSDNIDNQDYINILNNIDILNDTNIKSNLLLNLNSNKLYLIVNVSIKKYSDKSLINELPNEVILYEMKVVTLLRSYAS